MISTCTLNHVAKAVGVSPITVSRAFSGTAPVAAVTRRRIMEVAEELGYTPNILARGLRGGRTKTIGVLWSLGGPHQAVSMARSIAIRVQHRGYATNLADHLADPQVSLDVLDDFARRRIDGVVFQASPDLTNEEGIVSRLSRFPAAVVVHSQPTELPVDVIVRDGHAAIRDVADHFVRIGRKRPGILLPLPGNQYKADCFISRLRENGLRPAKQSTINVKWSGSNELGLGFWEAMDRSFGDGFPLDALFCSTDEGAMAAMAWLRGKGLRVPEDVAVVGFNDNPGSLYCNPPLASVAREGERVADLIEEMLFRRLDDPDLPLQREHVHMRFVLRESAGANSEAQP